ncbi:MAG: pyridoxal-phosphate dependent enzyme [Xanthomonadales bacterium]|nr:pyridoxal-phosphate dependent enzyme [Xanthomonadales bacterium]
MLPFEPAPVAEQSADSPAQSGHRGDRCGGFDSVLATIGHTPIVHLQRLSPPGVQIYAKLESRNPGGSVKDRMALSIIEEAERRGELRPGMTVYEATSGNTGIALAMVCARKGYPLVVTMAENFSVERRRLMRWLGARVVLTPAVEKGSGMLRKARELAQASGGYLCRQFDDEANPLAHQRGTAQEILRDFDGRRLDAVVSGFGTGGTLLGIARELRKHRPDTRIIACEPDNVGMLASGEQQKRAADGSPNASHGQFRPHPVQGWSPDFLSSLIEAARDDGLVDAVQPVSGEAAMRCARELARQEGILAGISSGATLAGALAVARAAEPGSVVLCVLPDSAERYLSSPLFAEISDDMDEAEWALSKSTPSARFDRSPTAAAPAQAVDAESLAWADQAMAQWTGDPSRPLVMFSLEWCEYCWAMRRFLQALGVPCAVAPLDGPEGRIGTRTLAMRLRLGEASGQISVPQLWFKGEWLGGCDEVFELYRRGELQARFREHGIAFKDAPIDADQFKPKWTDHRRSMPA